MGYWAAGVGVSAGALSVKARFSKIGTSIEETMIKRITAVKYFGSINPEERPFEATINATSPRTIIPKPT